MALKLIDIDDRLIHGQIASTWIPDLGIESVIIANDECANDPVQRSVAGLAAPGIKVSVFTVDRRAHEDHPQEDHPRHRGQPHRRPQAS